MEPNSHVRAAGKRPRAFTQLFHAWNHSLRFRLIWLGLMPLLLGLPIVLLSLGLVGGVQLNKLIEGQLNSNLSGAQNYLNVVRADLQSRIADLVQSDRITQLVQDPGPQHEVNSVLMTMLRGSGFDFLLIVRADGTVLGSSGGVERGKTIPPSPVIQQARTGVANSGFEQFTLEELSAFSPFMTQRVFQSTHRATTRSLPSLDTLQATGTLINAAAHFPLSVSAEDAVLVGGVFLNHNTAIIEHMREIIYPSGKLPDRIEGFVGIFVGQDSIVNSRLKTLGSSGAKLDPALLPTDSPSGLVSNRVGMQRIGEENYALAVSPIQSREEKIIAALAVGFPVAPFQHAAWLLLAIVAGLLGLIMLAISVVYLRAGNGIVQKIQKIAGVMDRFRAGNRSVFIDNIQRNDELGMLAEQVNELLQTVTKQEQEQIAAKKIILDEASRRRAIFKNVRDGIVILKEDGSVFEVNPQFCAMLNYAEDELRGLTVHHWDHFFAGGKLSEQIQSIARNQGTIESTYTRKDGSKFPIEISASRAEWGGEAFYLMLARDITVRKEQEDKLKLSASVFTSALEAIVLTDPDANITDINDAYTHIMGYTKSDVIGQRATTIGYTQNDQEMLQAIMASLRSTGFWSGEMTQQRKNGEVFPSLVKVSAVKNNAGEIVHFVAMFSDISLQKEQQLRLEQIALHDSLTGLANRQNLSDRLTHAMASSKRTGDFGAILMLDLDNFKPLNDAHGHAAGDQLLIEVGKRLKASVREVDTVARLGGDEFVVLLELLPDNRQEAEKLAVQVAEKIRTAIDSPFFIKHDGQAGEADITHRCTPSIGVAVFQGSVMSQTQVLNMADAAMYTAKHAGRNQVSLFQASPR